MEPTDVAFRAVLEHDYLLYGKNASHFENSPTFTCVPHPDIVAASEAVSLDYMYLRLARGGPDCLVVTICF